MVALGSKDRPFTIRRWLASTPRRTFVLYPALVLLIELLLHNGRPTFNPAGLLLLAWGYGQYRWSGVYRTREGGGGPGIDNPPTKLVDSGIYAYVRNPMYLGHLIFMAGLVVLFSSWAALALFAFHVWWFHQRVLEDEKHMSELFGPAFDAYAARVKRWGLV